MAEPTKLSPAGPVNHQAHMSFVDPKTLRSPKPKPLSWQGKIKRLVLAPLKNPRLLAILILGGITVLGLITIVTYAIYANSLATPQALINRKNSGLIFYDRNGQEFYRTAGAQDTTIIPLSKIPKDLQNATIAIEDKTFYQNPGFSITSIFRAILTNIQVGNPTAVGASTISQELVKNALLTQKKSFLRKFQELVLSIEINRRYSKDQILELYLTSTYYGTGAYGVQEAAETFFGKSLDQLDLAQSAMLAGLPQAPSAYSPIDGSADLAKQRQRQVLDAMLKQGYITQEQHDQAFAEQLHYQTAQEVEKNTASAPQFVDYLRNLLAKKYGEDTMIRSGFKIYTTLDSSLQQTAQQVVAKRISSLSRAGANNGALVAIDPTTGQILAMVGSADYSDDASQGKFNWATAPRQPGSSTKPFMYLTSFEDGYTPATILQDVPTDFNGYKPLDADRKFRGDVTVRVALANSLNIPAVEMLQKVGVGDFIDTFRNFGATGIQQESVNKCGLAVVLGCAEVSLVDLTHAYATLADQGTYNDLIGYTKIVDKNGNQIFPQTGLFSGFTSNQSKQLVDPGYTYLISDILNDNNARSLEFGLHSQLKLSRSAAVKTGTTDDSRDAWTVGYTPQVVMGVWVGNSNNTPMTLAGATGAAPIWHEVMEDYLRGKPVKWYDQPTDVVRLNICRGTESIADNGGDNVYSELFVKMHLPQTHCNATPSPTPTEQPTSTPSATPVPTPSTTPIATITPLPTVTPTVTPTITPFPTVIHPTINPFP